MKIKENYEPISYKHRWKSTNKKYDEQLGFILEMKGYSNIWKSMHTFPHIKNWKKENVRNIPIERYLTNSNISSWFKNKLQTRKENGERHHKNL